MAMKFGHSAKDSIQHMEPFVLHQTQAPREAGMRTGMSLTPGVSLESLSLCIHPFLGFCASHRPCSKAQPKHSIKSLPNVR